MVEYAEDLSAFVTNIFKPAEVLRVEKNEETGVVTVYVRKKSDLGIAIGKNGCNIEKARMLCKRYFGTEMGEIFVEGDRA